MGSTKQEMVFTPKEVRVQPLQTCKTGHIDLHLTSHPTLQIDFFAKDELVTIIPNFSLPTEGSRFECIMVGAIETLSILYVSL